jgi:Holliday junction resolvase
MSQKGYNSNYNKGIRAENKVAKAYRQNGWIVDQSKSNKGVADLKCTNKHGTIHYVQVKSASSGRKPYISNSELGNLKSAATRNGATAVIAEVTDKLKIQYAKTGNKTKL